MMVSIHRGSMTGKRRVERALALEKVDRIPIDYMANPAIHQRLAARLGVSSEGEHVADALGVDFRGLNPRYVGPQLFASRENRGVDPLLGSVTRWVPNDAGGYWDFCDFPLADADDEAIERWPVPDPDDFDYDSLLSACEAEREKAVFLGGAGLVDIMNSMGMIFGMENLYVHLAEETESVMRLIDRRVKSQLGMMERALDKCAKHVQFIWTGEDLGMQHAPLISLAMFRSLIRPRHQRMADLAKRYGKPVMMHCCGSSSWAFEDFIEMGIAAVDTLQPEATNMSPDYLSAHFGGRLAFHGCISTARLAELTPEQVDRDVRQTVDIMCGHEGYCLSPTHLIQDNTPVDNILAMYSAAHRYGVRT